MNAQVAIERFDVTWTPLEGAVPAWQAQIAVGELLVVCRHVREDGGRLVTLWGEQCLEPGREAFVLRVVLDTMDRLLLLSVELPSSAARYPDLSSVFPSADRLQRSTFDLLGIQAIGGDPRPWLRHQAWGPAQFPLRANAEPMLAPSPPDPYPFVRVGGEGVHEIPVGPVHAGIIEPGHFRFSVVGEKVLRLEERLGYVHKGVEKRLQGACLEDGLRVVARVSGDSAVAFGWAYAMAAESLTRTPVPARALLLRGLLLERERIANHLGDLGALGNDAGFAFAQAQFSRLKEDLLRDNDRLWRERYPMDEICIGGVRTDLDATDLLTLLTSLLALEGEVSVLREIIDNHAGVQDRFLGAGRLTREQAKTLGVVGMSARASGIAHDWRLSLRTPPYDAVTIRPALRHEGDVAARVAVRFEELFHSIQCCRALIDRLDDGPVFHAMAAHGAPGIALGAIEGWRGPILVALSVDRCNRIQRCHPHDPSWHVWPALELAVLGNIVPDFPLINKSFNLSYSGCDL